MDKAGLFGLVVDHRRKDTVRVDVLHHVADHLRGEQEVPFAEEFGIAMDAFKFLHECRVRAEAADGLLDDRLVTRDNDNVRFLGGLIQAHVRERHVERLQDVQEELVVEFVRLDPLHPESTRFHVPAHLRVELMAEEARHTAHPRVRGHADEHVVLAAVGEEERLGVVDIDMDARVVVAAGVPRVESLREVHHLVFDFHAVKVAEQRVGKQVVRAHTATEAHHAGIVGLREHGHRHEGRRRLGQFVTFDGVVAVLAHARVGLAVRLDVPVHVGFVETDGSRLAVADDYLFVGVQVLVGAERTRRNERRVEVHEQRGEHHYAADDVEHHVMAETLAVDEQEHKANREVEVGSENQRALELQVREQQKAATRRAQDRAERIPAVHLADGRFALEGARKDKRNERERHTGEETRRHHPQHRQRILEEAPADVAVRRRVENLVRLVHHAPEGLVEVERAQREERHENLRERKHYEGVLLEELAAYGATDGKSENKGGEHLVEAVARRAHQQRKQADPDDFVNERGEARDGRNPEPGALGRHRELVFGHVVGFGVSGFLRGIRRIFFLGRGCHEPDNAEDGREQEVDGGGNAKSSMVTEHGNERIARDQDAYRRTEAVREVEHRERDFGTAFAHEPRRDKRERHAHRNRDRERRTSRKHNLCNLGASEA